MHIMILGAGAMGCLFGGGLSACHKVTLVDTDPEKVAAIRSRGVRIRARDGDRQYYPAAFLPRELPEEVPQLLLVFVKSMYEEAALEGVRHLIGPDTWLMSLQNGMGHEAVLGRYQRPGRIIIGATQHNSSLLEKAYVNHGGGGQTHIGPLEGPAEALQEVADALTAGGFSASVAENVRGIIWNKLFLNASASALTALLQCPLGTVVDSAPVWEAAKSLIAEAVAVANAEGQQFDAEQVTEEIRRHLEGAKGGYTSIYADIRDGRRTEVDTISGSIVAAGARLGVETPRHSLMVQLIHAMERKA